MVILDELNIVLRYGYLDVGRGGGGIGQRRGELHVVVTGRNAQQS